ncbi:MAG: hypothetical protein IJ228_04595, partial [Succinivibrio sp.]|nr:hypothetical protein [Succinivibrio sp.]
VETEEAWTSKCSFFDRESLEHHEEYLGKRIRRGLFKTSQGLLVNADVNGALNIMRKVFSDVTLKSNYGIAGCGSPVRIRV